MADRRMIHRKVIESDAFYALPESAQALYTHLCINADDDGFINCASSIAVRIKAGKAALQKLVDSRFVLRFGEIYVIKHWRIGNSLRNDRLKTPTFPGIAAQIWVKSNRAYTDHPVDGGVTLLELKTGIQSGIPNGTPNGIQNGSLTEQNRTEQKGTEQNRTAEADFERLWLSYPEARRGSKASALEAFRVDITSQEDADKAMADLEAWKRSDQWCKDGGQYVPYLCNWLERGIWRTKPPEANKEREFDADEVEAIRRMMAEE